MKLMWIWLNGKKSVVGSAMLIISDHIHEPWTRWTLKITGALFAATGYSHKIIKLITGRDRDTDDTIKVLNKIRIVIIRLLNNKK